MSRSRRKEHILIYILMALLLLAAAAVQIVSYQKNRIPAAGTSGSLVTQAPGYSNGRIQINTASAEMLAALPGIGDVLSQRIVDYREIHGPFSHAKELLQVEGISQSVLDKCQKYIDVSVSPSDFSQESDAFLSSFLSATAPPYTLSDAVDALVAHLATVPDTHSSFLSSLPDAEDLQNIVPQDATCCPESESQP